MKPDLKPYLKTYLKFLSVEHQLTKNHVSFQVSFQPRVQTKFSSKFSSQFSSWGFPGAPKSAFILYFRGRRAYAPARVQRMNCAAQRTCRHTQGRAHVHMGRRPHTYAQNARTTTRGREAKGGDEKMSFSFFFVKRNLGSKQRSSVIFSTSFRGPKLVAAVYVVYGAETDRHWH